MEKLLAKLETEAPTMCHYNSNTYLPNSSQHPTDRTHAITDFIFIDWKTEA